jgi:hypothetical protein
MFHLKYISNLKKFLWRKLFLSSNHSQLYFISKFWSMIRPSFDRIKSSQFDFFLNNLEMALFTGSAQQAPFPRPAHAALFQPDPPLVRSPASADSRSPPPRSAIAGRQPLLSLLSHASCRVGCPPVYRPRTELDPPFSFLPLSPASLKRPPSPHTVSRFAALPPLRRHSCRVPSLEFADFEAAVATDPLFW